MTSSRGSTILGLLGAAFLILFWLGGLAPERSDALLRPYGLFVWSGVLLAATVLPTVAAIRGPKWWFLLAAVSAITTVRVFFLAVT